ncbi:hypothetical protein J1N35_028829, partial [Gossypium stocksii]
MRYNNNISRQPFYFEQWFLFKDAPYIGYDEFVSSIVEKHGWNIFCLHYKDILGKIFREFYAHVNSLYSPFIYIR